jgi:hypothetical protein
MEDIRLALLFWASPAFLPEKNQVWRFQHSWLGRWHLFRMFRTNNFGQRL